MLPEKLEIYSSELRAYMTFDPASIWARVGIPVCALWGAEDRVVPVELSRNIIESGLRRGNNRNYFLKTFAGAGHGISFNRRPDEAWDFPRLAPGYQQTMIQWVRTVRYGAVKGRQYK